MSVVTLGDERTSTISAAPNVVISNGLNRFHLAIAAAEIARTNNLALMFTAGYPTRRIRWLAAALGNLGRSSGLARLLDRSEEIPESLVAPLWWPELFNQLAAVASSRGARRFAEVLNYAAFRTFARGAARRFRRASLDAQIYHYRSGFGLVSVVQAKNDGLVALCDHSIVHPMSLGELIGSPTSRLTRPWRTVLRDLELADHVLVNSDFVKATFVERGWDPERIDVIYLGVDDRFLASVSDQPAALETDGVLRLLFAGSFASRKGVDSLVEALSRLHDIPWRLEIAGGLTHESRKMHRRFFEDRRVFLLGALSRQRLAEVMAANDVFVFPTLAEGSARVVFEALACGLYVITTPNAGSIVVDGVHGALVPPHSPDALVDALHVAASNRDALKAIGRENAALVRNRYRQRDYGRALVDLYAKLAAR